jgi:hypothetical protein
MRMNSSKILPEVSDVVVGLFTHLKNAKDAICDLAAAGFSASQINVAYASGEAQGHPDLLRAEHTLVWRLRSSFERDMHHHGADLLRGPVGSGDVGENSPYTEVNLREALSEIGVAPERISLLEDEIGAGVLVLVKSGGHAEKASTIMEKNEGTIRTDTALEAGGESVSVKGRLPHLARDARSDMGHPRSWL